jgi:1-acyl-sn-glycerol-3-phosphate acyltransferase
MARRNHLKDLRTKVNYYLKELVATPIYHATRIKYLRLLGQYFSFTQSGFENLPRESAVLAMNHHSGLDGFLVSAGVAPRRVHYLAQVSGINSQPAIKLFLWAYGEIPVIIPENRSIMGTDEEKLQKIKENSTNMAAMRRAIDYLRISKDYVGIFVDGPAKDLRDQNYRLKPLEERSCSESAILIASAANKMIIPVSVNLPERVCDALWEYNWKDRRAKEEWIKSYVAERGKIPCELKAGKPIDPRGEQFGKNGEKRRVEVSRVLKEAIIELG